MVVKNMNLKNAAITMKIFGDWYDVVSHVIV